MLAQDYFALFGLPKTASAEDVKRAFVAAAKQWHPDRTPAGLEDLRSVFAEVFARLDEARQILSDAAKRQAYLAEGAPPPASQTKIPAGATTEAQLEYRKAEAFLKRSDLAQADQHARRAVQLAPKNHDFQAMLLWIQASKPDATPERLRGVLADLDKICAKDETCERAFHYRGTIRKRLDMIPQAMSDFTKAAELNPHNVDAAREVRLYRMRQEGTKEKDKDGDGDAGGLGSFFKKLFKG